MYFDLNIFNLIIIILRLDKVESDLNYKPFKGLTICSEDFSVVCSYSKP